MNEEREIERAVEKFGATDLVFMFCLGFIVAFVIGNFSGYVLGIEKGRDHGYKMCLGEQDDDYDGQSRYARGLKRDQAQ